jgi:hypothetical protein
VTANKSLIKLAARFTAESMLVLTSILHLGKSGLPTKPITPDDADRISFCLKVLSEQTPAINVIFQVSLFFFLLLEVFIYYRIFQFKWLQFGTNLTHDICKQQANNQERFGTIFSAIV